MKMILVELNDEQMQTLSQVFEDSISYNRELAKYADTQEEHEFISKEISDILRLKSQIVGDPRCTILICGTSTQTASCFLCRMSMMAMQRETEKTPS